LSKEEKQLVHLYWGNFTTKLHMGFRLHKQGILDAESYQTWEDFLLAAMHGPGVRGWWAVTHRIYAPDFVDRINRRLADADNQPPSLADTIPYFNAD